MNIFYTPHTGIKIKVNTFEILFFLIFSFSPKSADVRPPWQAIAECGGNRRHQQATLIDVVG